MSEVSLSEKRGSVINSLSKQLVQIQWESVTFDVRGAKKKVPLRILYGVSGFANPGECLAIMGSSGAGKTTLLNCLSGRQLNGKLGGILRANGQQIVDRKTFRKVAAFVTQDDLMLATQTVREILEFSAALRNSPSTSRSERREIVDEILNLLHLDKIAGSLVGDPSTGGISGGERKRVNIGAELVTHPTVIFLDEPTTGLDAYTALRVMLIVQQLASGGRTIVSTIHQPASEIFQSFDAVMLMHQGSVAYFGPRGEVIPYFSSLGVECPPFHNPADFLVNVLMRQLREQDESFPDFRAAYEGSARHAAALEPPKISGCEAKVCMSAERGAAIPLQCAILFWRILTNWKRNKLGLRVRTGQTVFFGLLAGLIFYDIPQYDDTIDGIFNRRGALFFAVVPTDCEGTHEPRRGPEES